MEAYSNPIESVVHRQLLVAHSCLFQQTRTDPYFPICGSLKTCAVRDVERKEQQQYSKMAEANPIENLALLIGEVCTKISTLNKREPDINKNSTSEIDLVEKDILLRRIRVERRELQKQLAD